MFGTCLSLVRTLLAVSDPRKKYVGGLGGANRSTKCLLNVVWLEFVRICSGKAFQVRVVEGI